MRGWEAKLLEAKRLQREATIERRREVQAERAADRCACGHRRDQHTLSTSINYTEGYCMACPEKNHHSVCQWFNFKVSGNRL